MKKYYLSSASLFGLPSVCSLVFFLIAGIVSFIFTGNCWLFIFLLITGGVVSVVIFLEPLPEFVFWLAKILDYDGVELHLSRHVINSILENPEYYDQLARKYNLGLTYHQPWMIMDIFAKIAVLVGLMPHPKHAVNKLIAVLEKGIKPVVVHSDLVGQIPREYHSKCRVEIVDYSILSYDNDIQFSKKEGLVFDCWYSLRGNIPPLIKKGNDITLDWLYILITWNEILNKHKYVEFHLYGFTLNKKFRVKKNLMPNMITKKLQGIIEMTGDDKVFVYEISTLEIIFHPVEFLNLTKKR